MDANKLARYRRGLLYTALGLALLLVGLDRYAAWRYLPDSDATAGIVYGAAWCGPCHQVKQWLDDNDVPYTEYDVEKSFAGAMGFWALRGRSVPLTVIGPEVVPGFRVQRITDALQKIGYDIQ